MTLRESQEIALTSLRHIGDAISEIAWAAGECTRSVPFEARVEQAIGMLEFARKRLELALKQIEEE